MSHKLTAYLDTLRAQIADALGYSVATLEGMQLTHALEDVESVDSPVDWSAIHDALANLGVDIDSVVL